MRRGQAVAKALSAALLRLPSAMVRAGVIPPTGELATEKFIREQLEELSRLKSAAYLAGEA